MKVFVVNCGSSSLKWSVVDTASGSTLGSGTVQQVRDHAEALESVLRDAPIDDLGAIAHRVVHGGERFAESALIDGEATVKTFQRKDGHVWLLPHNTAYDPIPGDNATILGVVTAVLRSL